MGSSLISRKGYGFWARDPDIEVLLWLMVNEIDAISSPPAWLIEAKDDWHIYVKYHFNGCISLGLDNHAATDEQAEVIIAVTESYLNKVRSYGEAISREELTKAGVGGSDPWQKDYPVERALRIGHRFLQLLRNEITTTASDREALP